MRRSGGTRRASMLCGSVAKTKSWASNDETDYSVQVVDHRSASHFAAKTTDTLLQDETLWVVSRIFRTFIMRRLRFQIAAVDRVAAYSWSIWPTTLFSAMCRSRAAARLRQD